MTHQNPIADHKLLAERKEEYLKFESPEKLTWCGGCGNYGIQNALERALVIEGYKTRDVLFCYDIGCHGNSSDKIGGIGGVTLHGLHGRVIPAAAGAALANRRLKVIAEAGDGGTISEGINHLVHAIRSDYPMVFILHNNENYGLTTGQASSTTRRGMPMNGSPDGVLCDPFNVCEFVLSLRPSFVARAYGGDVNHMTDVLRAAVKHDGFAFVEIMQLCPTYNKATSQTWFMERLRQTDQLKGYDPSSLESAKKAAADLDNEIAIGVLYQKKDNVSFLNRVPSRKDAKTELVDEVKPFDISKLMKGME